MSPCVTSATRSTVGKKPAKRWTEGVIGQLNAEWDHLCVDLRTADEVAGWRTTEPALAGLTDLSELTSYVGRNPDAVLLALLRLGHAGHQLAARAVLQAMVPKIVRIAASQPAWCWREADVLAVAVAAMWEKITTYPLADRPRSVAAQLALDTLKIVVATTTSSSKAGSQEVSIDFSGSGQAGEQPRWDDEPVQSAGEEVLSVLHRAVERGVIRVSDAQLLAKVYCTSDAYSGASLADQLGASRAAIRQRCSRLVRQLHQHAELLAA